MSGQPPDEMLISCKRACHTLRCQAPTRAILPIGSSKQEVTAGYRSQIQARRRSHYTVKSAAGIAPRSSRSIGRVTFGDLPVHACRL